VVREHAERLDEALPLLDGFLRGERVDHDGVHYQVHAQLDPPAVQQPRPPIWAGITVSGGRPLARARGVDGIFPLAGLRAPTPDEIADLLRRLDPPDGYDVVGVLSEVAGAAELRDAGATWAIDGPDGPEEPLGDILARIEDGPPA
jgi:hypothetical protein